MLSLYLSKKFKNNFYVYNSFNVFENNVEAKEQLISNSSYDQQ